jgi:hypothetical protein
MRTPNRAHTVALAATLLVAGCGSGTTKTVTVAKAPTSTASTSTAAGAFTTGPTGATGATGTTNAAQVAATDANTLLNELETAWDSDNAGGGLDGILAYNVIYDYQSSGFTPIKGFKKVRDHILGLLNSNGKHNKLALTGVTVGNDGIGTYATGTWVSTNVNGQTGTFQIRFVAPGPSPFKNDPCASTPCIKQITLVPTPAPVQQG